MVTEADLYTLAEEMLSFEDANGVLNLEGLEAFAGRTEHLTPQQHADLLNLANDIKAQRGETNESTTKEQPTEAQEVIITSEEN